MSLLGRVGCTVWLLLALGGCRPALVWYGHGPDRLHRVEVLESGGHQRVELDGQPGEDFEGIALEAITFSEDGRHLAFAAQSEQGWHVVLDGHRGPAHEGIGAITLSTDGARMAYAAHDRGAWRIVLDGREGPAFESLLAETLRFSDDGSHLVYVAQTDRGVTVVHDQQPGAVYDGVRALQLMTTTGQPVYVARRGRQSFVVRGTKPAGALHDGVGELVLAGQRIAYAALSEPNWYAVVGSDTTEPYRRVDELTFSLDGRKLAFVAQRGDAQLVVVDGVNSPPHRQVLRGTLSFSPEGALFYVARPKEQSADSTGDDAPSAGVRLFIDGVPGPPYDSIGPPVFARTGSHWAALAVRDGRSVVLVDGRPSIPYAWADDLQLSDDGTRFAYLARRGPYDMVVHTAGRSALPTAVRGSLVLDATGHHWACLAAIRSARKLSLMVDGVPQRDFDMAELTAELSRSPVATSQGPKAARRWIRRWVAAELARSLRAR